jgi:putative ABC transport system ATP-binding protein
VLRVSELRLLNGRVVSLDLAPGEGVVVRGANGAGKSLFLRSLARLLPASAAEFTLDGARASDLAPEVLRSRLLYVAAAPSLLSGGTVADFFKAAFRLEIYENHRPAFPYRDYLRRWGLDQGQEFSALSTGQRQLLAILRALSLAPRVLLLDEPTANLDHERTLAVEELLRDWQRRTGGGLVVVCHSDAQAARLGFRTVEFL